MTVKEEFRKLLDLLHIEREEDLKTYYQKIKDTSIIARRQEGVCWYPVQVENTSFDAGERLLVKLSRPKEHEHSHSFRSGSLVSIYSNKNNKQNFENSVSGIINYVKKDYMIVTLEKNTEPEDLNLENIVVQLMFDDSSYLEMETALQTIINPQEKRLQKLINILYGIEKPFFNKQFEFKIPSLNDIQNKAVNLISSAQDLAIVHGPPGTGKTTTLIQSIIHTLKTEKQILVCAPSNAAVDLLASKLTKKLVNVVRIGHPARVTEDSLQLTLDYKITRHAHFKELKALKKETEEYFNLAGKYKRNFGQREREERKELYKTAADLKKECSQLEYYITRDIIFNAQVIACTLVGANNKILNDLHFKTVYIDEAAQALEPASWIPIIKSDRVIFAGDHFQLPPTVKSYEAAKAGLDITLFEKVIAKTDAEIMLSNQYRMNNKIMNFSAGYFYKKQLYADETVAEHKIFEADFPLEFIDTAGCGFAEEINPETLSTFNKEEADVLFKHFTKYIETADYHDKLATINDIGIISPYNAQVAVIKELFDNSEFDKLILDKISINSVDSFQGQERDIIYISLVRSNEQGNIGFLSDIRRMNVAMTRAKKKLVIIGDSATITRNEFYDKLLDYIDSISAYRSAFEYLY